MSSSNDTAVETSMVSKKPESSWKEQGISRSARAAAKAATRLPGERMRMTMSSGLQGRRVPSGAVTGKPSSKSSRMRRAAKRASAVSFLTGWGSSADF
jgi:hypothetical protein